MVVLFFGMGQYSGQQGSFAYFTRPFQANYSPPVPGFPRTSSAPALDARYKKETLGTLVPLAILALPAELLCWRWLLGVL